MATLIEEVRLIFSDLKGNNNKYWNGKLYDDNRVIVEWGRIGSSGQDQDMGVVGKRFLDRKKNEKIRKGYTELKVLSDSAETKVIANGSLHEIAKKQIQSDNPLVDKLIERLVKQNVHKITSETEIKYNANTGTFSTPLGIVTLDAISEARTILADIDVHITKGDTTSDTIASLISQYMRLIPQKIKGRLDIAKIFPDKNAIKNQSDILDALEASYNTVTTQPQTVKKKKVKEEVVFSVKLSLASQDKVDEISKLYKKTLHRNHSASHLNVKTVYEVHIASMAEAFEKKGKAIGNIMQLWHGTKAANLLSILKSGLKVSPPSTANITGKLFGNGIYGTDISTKALNYAYGYWDGKREQNCFMFLCDFALGKTYIPKGQNYGSFPKKDYDSTFAKSGESGVQNNEMIVYNDYQVNLLFLIEFN